MPRCRTRNTNASNTSQMPGAVAAVTAVATYGPLFLEGAKTAYEWYQSGSKGQNNSDQGTGNPSEEQRKTTEQEQNERKAADAQKERETCGEQIQRETQAMREEIERERQAARKKIEMERQVARKEIEMEQQTARKIIEIGRQVMREEIERERQAAMEEVEREQQAHRKETERIRKEAQERIARIETEANERIRREMSELEALKEELRRSTLDLEAKNIKKQVMSQAGAVPETATTREDSKKDTDKPEPPSPVTLPPFCQEYWSQKECTKRTCQQLHLCRLFMAGICKFGDKCRRDHSLDSTHNKVSKMSALYFLT